MRNFRITVNGNTYDVAIEEVAGGVSAAPAMAPLPQAPAAPVTAPPKAAPAAPKPAANASATKVTAPMPGKILSVKVEQGGAVKKGDVLLTLEAMKMENEILAPCDGKIDVLQVAKGANVETGDLLLSIV